MNSLTPMISNLSSVQNTSKEGPLPILKIFESLPGLYLILSPELTILCVSNTYLQETFTERKAIVGKNVFEVFPDNPDTAEARATANLLASFQLVLSSARPHTMGLEHYDVPDPHKAGGFVERYWKATNTPVLNEQEEVSYIIHEVVNVTEKVKTKYQLEESQNREREALAKAEQQRAHMERFLMQAPAIIVVHDGPDLVFEFINPLYQQVFPGRDLLGKPLLEGLPELAGTPIWDIIQQVYQTGKTYEGRETLIPLAAYEGGPLRNNYYNFIYQARHDEQGKVDGLMVFAYDVTDQVVARKTVEDSVERLRFMANAMPQKVWTANGKGEVDYFNQKWLDYTGLSSDYLQGWGWKEIIHPEDWPETEKMWKGSLESDVPFQLEHRFRRNDGKYRWHLSRGLPQRNEEGTVSIWIGTNTDIHDQKLNEQSLQELTSELTEANKELTRINIDLDTFIYTASHDLKAPITNIEGLLQLLLKKLPESSREQEQVQPIVRMMETSVERFKRTITNLTDITRLQKDSEQEATLVQIPGVIQEVLLDLDQMIQEGGARVEEDTAECAELTFAEKNLRSILYNLISNAVKYRSPERDPRVHISCRKIPGFAVLCVQDNGLGIDLKQEKKLFSMFRRLHNHVEGSGIGLFMVKRIVENAGGRIEVKSALGEGSVFTVYLRQQN